MAYVEAHQALLTHRKTLRLARLLDLDKYATVGRLMALWWWALDNAQDGEIAKSDSDILADVMGWDGEPDALVTALVAAGWLESYDDHFLIHDWMEYVGRLIERRRENAERMRRARARAARGDGDETPRATHVQRTSSARAGATVPNRTLPYQETPTVGADEQDTAVSAPPAAVDSAPVARSTKVSPTSPVALPERFASDTTERAYWERVMKDLPSHQRLPALVSLAHDKIGADDTPGCATYGRLGQLARKHTASLVAVWIIQAAGQHIAGDPLDYLTKLVGGQIGRTAQRAQAATEATRPKAPTMIPASEADRWWESLPHDAPGVASTAASAAAPPHGDTSASATNGDPARQSKPPGALGSAARPPTRAAGVIDLATVRAV
jgi:hypothetical protein